MNEIRVEKSRLRRAIEIVFYVWGVFGIVFALVVAQKVVGLPIQQDATTNLILAAILHVFIWIGGLVFLGLLAMIMPIKMTLPR